MGHTAIINLIEIRPLVSEKKKGTESNYVFIYAPHIKDLSYFTFVFLDYLGYVLKVSDLKVLKYEINLIIYRTNFLLRTKYNTCPEKQNLSMFTYTTNLLHKLQVHLKVRFFSQPLHISAHLCHPQEIHVMNSKLAGL